MSDAAPASIPTMSPGAAPADERRFRRLRLYNLVMGLFHAASGVAILALANDFSLPVSATFLNNIPGLEPPKVTELFQFRIAWGVAAFVFLSALAHWILVLPGVFEWYRKNLLRTRNYARWIEYSVSSSLMVVLIALLTGITDIAALGGIFGVNAAMVLFGLLMEHYEQPGSPNWLSYWFGVLAGIVPWLLIAVYLWTPNVAASPPGFVYAIFVVLFVFFNSFAVNMMLQYKRIGPWRDYLFGESVYVFLSLAAKSTLAWMVFANTLVQ